MAALLSHFEIVQLLLDNGAKPNDKEEYRRTLLHFATANGHLQIANLLLEKGAKSKEKDEWTPLHLASVYGQFEIANLLLEKGANIDEKVLAGSTAFGFWLWKI